LGDGGDVSKALWQYFAAVALLLFLLDHLWTFRGLDAARRLYESVGFSLVEELKVTQWGQEIDEQRYVRGRPKLTFGFAKAPG